MTSAAAPISNLMWAVYAISLPPRGEAAIGARVAVTATSNERELTSR
jgi:hypothetical protein